MKVTISFEHKKPHYLVKMNGDVKSVLEDIGDEINIVLSNNSELITCQQIRAVSEILEGIEIENISGDKIDVSLLI